MKSVSKTHFERIQPKFSKLHSGQSLYSSR